VRRYIIRRLLQSVLILFVLSLIVFGLLHIKPGANPALIECGLNCTDERLEGIEERMGLNDPLYPVTFNGDAPFVHVSAESQYRTWGASLFDGSLGRDWNGNSVGDELQRRLPVTLELLVITTLMTVAIGVPFGIISAVLRNSPADYGVRFSSVLALAVPNFWIATLVLLVPQEQWGYAPPLTNAVSFFGDPWDNLRQFVPPSAVLAAASAAGIMRLTRSSMLEVMRQDYIRTARSKGLREQLVVGRHALKNSLIPVATVLGLQVAGLFGGAIIVESIFNLPGVGIYALGALIREQYQVAQTVTLYIGAVVVLMNLGVDVMYAWLDPRIRYS
jgi:peptide/nickel transport system permease protein